MAVTESPASPAQPSAPAKRESVFTRLYTGTGAFDVIGRRRRYYLLTAALVLVSLGSILFRGFELGIDFEGGTRVQLPAGTASTEQVETAYADALGMDAVSVQTVGSGGSATIQIRSQALDDEQVGVLRQALFEEFQPVGADGAPDINSISDAAVSETWGGEITRQAVIALVVFLVLVTVFIAVRFERDMAVAALVSLVHDVVVTAGVYSIVGFEVTPGTVIGLLTILGFSLYDTVVVFDKVQENTRGVFGLTRRTYAEQANLAVNQTFMRSINTTIIAVLPVLGLLVIGVGVLGVGTLADLALVQLTGIMVGIFSSIYLAAPVLVSLKERSAEVAAHTSKVLARRATAAQRDGATPREGSQDDSVVPVAAVAAPSGSTAWIPTTAPAAAQPAARPAARTPAGPPAPRTAPRPGARPAGKRQR